MYREVTPPPKLLDWVECGWIAEVEADTQTQFVTPDGCIDMLFNPQTGLSVVGAMTHAKAFHLPKGTRIIAVRFRPGMANAFLREPAPEITDAVRPVAAPDEKLWDAPSSESALQALFSLLHPRYEGNKTPTQRAIAAATRASGDISIDFLSDQAGLSPRQFRRCCLAESGLTPKTLCRVLRFRKAFRTAGSQRAPDWARIAADCGYCDQSHLIHDFQEFAGMSPMTVFSNTALP